jgi:hypothetical protein
VSLDNSRVARSWPCCHPLEAPQEYLMPHNITHRPTIVVLCPASSITMQSKGNSHLFNSHFTGM